MRRFLLSILLLGAVVAASAQAQFTTPGNGTDYTPARLAATPGSGVTLTADGVYAFASNVTIAAGDSFSPAGATALLLGDNVTLRLDGLFNLDRGDARLTVAPATETAKPRGIVIGHAGKTPATVSGLDFTGAALRDATAVGLRVDGCTFTAANGRLSSIAALALGDTGASYVITDCHFEDCTVPAIGSAANAFCGIDINGCTFINNNTSNTNKPQLNLTVGGALDVKVRDCTLTGAGLNMVGGIAVGNLLVNREACRVAITGCTITGHRYGITGVGPMTMEIRDNVLKDNCHETNAMNGGSGISLAGYGYGLDAILSGNHIEGSLWGVTLIQCRDVNLGQVGRPDSPGGNVFVNNGNGGVPYDLYNNQAAPVYAQLNTWAVTEQTAEQIATVIFDHADNPSLGEVTYMPAADGAGISDIVADDRDESEARYYNLQGVLEPAPGHGLYIRVLPGRPATKVAR